ncbi:MAG: DUF1549 domain-containing protein, partial [Verrucomicrobiota bacterium]|nr:DUF1549 domain-containing protein [Verrucomicrobiota bacterium]
MIQCVSGLLLFCLAVPSLLAAAPSKKIDYNRDIRPILAENCFSCHGPDSASRKAGLRLDSFEAATAARKDALPAIIPGKPDESETIKRVFTSDEDDIMPPAKSKKALKPEDKEKLRQWIAEGAEYQLHWSLLPPSRPPVPEVRQSGWVENPIDHFVLARLEKEGLKPNEEADRRTLARRVTLDLTGLPPSPTLLETFLKDKAPGAYERLVDQLLSSKHFGEHRARYWLDAARYADTHGIHIDNFREIWSYRAWVIDAFNKNMPFDQFTIEQLAGDLLPNPSLEQKIATGFNRCNITTSEGGAIDEEYLVLYTRDRTETTSQVWLGLTAGCAVCHDHKYDPLSQKEFYQMSAFFNNTTQPAMDGNKKDTPPIVVVPKAEDRKRWEALPEIINSSKKRVEDRRAAAKEDHATWLRAVRPEAILGDLPLDRLQFSAPLNDGELQTIQSILNGYPKTLTLTNKPVVKEGIISANAFVTSKEIVPVILEAGDFERDQPFSAGVWVRISDEDKEGSILAR